MTAIPIWIADDRVTGGAPDGVEFPVTSAGGRDIDVVVLPSGAINFGADPGTAFADLPAGVEDTATLSYTVSDGALTDTASITVTVTGVNDDPEITGPTETTIVISELINTNGAVVADVDASDIDGDTLVYAISGGADASFFDVDAATGVVSIPNELLIFGDDDGNALYEVEVTVTDGNGGLDTIDLTFNLFASA